MAAASQDQVTATFKDASTGVTYELVVERRPRETAEEFRKRATEEIDAWLEDLRGQ